MSQDRDVDLLLLIREEEAYAGRIKAALVFSESKLERGCAPLSITTREDRSYYDRPISPAEEEEESSTVIHQVELARRSCRDKNKCQPDITIPAPPAYINPPIDRRRVVDDQDALYSESTDPRAGVMFTYADLVATREKRKATTVRQLRPLANLWEKDPKLNKEAMLTAIIDEYVRRFPEEVHAYEKARRSASSARGRRPRRRGRRR